MSTRTLARFDDTDRLNDDGTVTYRTVPSNWRRYNVSPDTYQLVPGDSWCESEIDYWREQTGRDLGYDDLSWTYDHAGIVRAFGEVLAEWLRETLTDLGLTSLRDVKVTDSWSPQFYNFTSDGFEIEFTCDPAQLRDLTPTFDVDEWVHEWYRSCDGFISYVPRRMEDDDWRAEYDAGFRIEHLLLTADPRDDDKWRFALHEAEDEVYRDHTHVAVIEPEYMDSGYTLPDLIEWANALIVTQPETLL